MILYINYTSIQEKKNEKTSHRQEENICKRTLSKIHKELLTVNNKINLITKWIKDLDRHLTEDIQMANKHMKRCSTSYVTRELQIGTRRYHYLPIRMAKIQNTDTTKTWGPKNFSSLLIGMRNSTYTLEESLAVSYKTKMLLPYDPVITLFGICPKELKTGPHENQHMNVCGSLINNCQNLEATKISFSRLVDM